MPSAVSAMPIPLRGQDSHEAGIGSRPFRSRRDSGRGVGMDIPLPLDAPMSDADADANIILIEWLEKLDDVDAVYHNMQTV